MQLMRALQSQPLSRDLVVAEGVEERGKGQFQLELFLEFPSCFFKRQQCWLL